MTFKRGDFDKQIEKLPKEVIWCKKCTISNQRPRIVLTLMVYVQHVIIEIIKIK